MNFQSPINLQTISAVSLDEIFCDPCYERADENDLVAEHLADAGFNADEIEDGIEHLDEVDEEMRELIIARVLLGKQLAKPRYDEPVTLEDLVFSESQNGQVVALRF